ncbi:MAG: hypothetical protein D3903_13905 [Candidatus Electrothrix sp. GM3_4]|nr:hypothetical protein [Candidatus Electrothrix sp. GM3_4]
MRKSVNTKIEQLSDNKLVLHYSSSRKLCSFGLGLIQGLAMGYGEKLHIRETSCMRYGASECCIEVTGEEQQKPDKKTALQPKPDRKRALDYFGFFKKQQAVSVPAVADCTGGPPIIIVGMGLTGIRAAHEILQKRTGCMIMVYGDEPWEPYNRVRLSELLAGDIDWEKIVSTLGLKASDNIDLRINNRVEKIDLKNRLIIDENGWQQPYSHLILATGSQARPVEIKGKELPGIYTYRNIEDTQRLLVQTIQSTSMAVIGGGILGIEVAFALKQQNPDAEVTIIHRNSFLMNRELDQKSAHFLLQQVKKKGIRVYLDSCVTECIGKKNLEQIILSDGTCLSCDTLISCIGTVQNAEIARKAGLEVGRGITVNPYMQTSNPFVYAVGECIEYNGKIYGTLAPCTEQAVIAVDNILYGNHRAYHDANLSIRAKIKHLPIFSLKSSQRKCTEQAVTKIHFCHPQNTFFRQLILYRGRLVGARAVGEWSEINIVQEAIDNRMWIWPWRKWYFLRYGTFSPDIAAGNIMNLHQTAIICCCNNVTRAQLSTAVSKGNHTVEELSGQTGAGQSCGSCIPLLAQIAGTPESACTLNSSSSGFGFFLLSFFAILLPIFTAFSGVPVPMSVLEQKTLPVLLQHASFQQFSGYTVLFFLLLTFVLTINKRFNRLNFFHYIIWRTVHVLVAVLAGMALLLHTNFSTGRGFFLQMMLLFLMITLTGGVLSTAIALEKSFFSAIVRKSRYFLLKIHWMFVTFFFAYVLMHIVACYYF